MRSKPLFQTVALAYHKALLIEALIRLMDKILHDLKGSKLWGLWYIPYNG